MNFFIKILKNFLDNNDIYLNFNFLEKNYFRFFYFSSSIANEKLEILKAEDNIGGYYDNKLILPYLINVSNNLLNAYIYRILFSLESKDFNFYLKKDKKNNDYIILNTILIVKKINLILFKNYPGLIKIVKKLFFDIYSKRKSLNFLSCRAFLIEVLIKKYMYQRIKFLRNLTDNENFWIYLVENSEFDDVDYLYDFLCNIYYDYSVVEFNQIWGYLYYKSNVILKYFKRNLDVNENKFFFNLEKKNVLVKSKELKYDAEKKNNLNSLFDYKKTLDNYRSYSNKSVNSLNVDNLDFLKNINFDNAVRSSFESSSNFSLNSINNVLAEKDKKDKFKNKKFIYKEWDFNIKKYKHEWCEVFLNDNKNIFKVIDRNLIDKHINDYKKEILLFKKKIELIMNKKMLVNNLCSGLDLDIDSIIDNYKYVKEFDFKKIYTDKRFIKKDFCFCLMFDSSLSTDSFLNNIKIIDFLKILIIIISCGLNDLVKSFFISSFYSNTRHDCKYIFVKKFKDDWKNSKYNLSNLYPIGYTRIGPALRHSVNELNKYNFRKKFIILLSDGKPTDYDEYEGLYGVNDVRRAAMEARLKNIKIKSLIINKNKKQYFETMFGKNNFYLIKNLDNVNFKLSKLFLDIILK